MSIAPPGQARVAAPEVLTRRRRPVRRRFFIALAVLLVVAAVGFVGYQRLFHRQSDDALRMIPADAVLVATIDLQPGPSQLMTFRQIANELRSSGLDSLLDEILQNTRKDAPILEVLKPCMGRAGVFVVLPPSSSSDRDSGSAPTYRWALLWALTDPSAGQAALAKNGKKDAGDVYELETPHVCATVIGGFLAVSEYPDPLKRLAEDRKSLGKSIADDPDYRAARARVGSDANVTFVVTRHAMDEWTRDSRASEDVKEFPRWVAAGLTVENEGLHLRCAGSVRPPEWDSVKAAEDAKPLSAGDLSRLPSGAYAVTAEAQPAKYGLVAQEMARRSSDYEAQDMDRVLSQLADACGADFRNKDDALLQGNILAAAYPSGDSGTEGLDLLVVADNANGARPAEMVEHIGARLDRVLEGTRFSGAFFESQTFDGAPGGAVRAAIVNDVTSQMRNDMRRSTGRIELNPGAPYQEQTRTSKYERLLDNKTIAYAEVDGAILVATSTKLLERAVRAYRDGNDTLAKDVLVSKPPISGARALAAVDVSRVCAGIEETADWTNTGRGGEEIGHRVLSLFKDMKSVAYVTASYEHETVSADAFVPLDYAKVIAFAGDELKRADDRGAFRSLVQSPSSVEEAHLNQMVRAAIMYANDNQDRFPVGTTMSDIRPLLMPYAKSHEIFETVNPNGGEFLVNPKLSGVGEATILTPAEVPIFYDSVPWPNGMRCVALCDGHVKMVGDDEFAQLMRRISEMPTPASPSTTGGPPSGSLGPVPVPPAGTTQGKWQWTSERDVTGSDLAGMSAADLDLMRNEIYARRGWQFERRADLRAHFAAESWYHVDPAGNDAVTAKMTDREKRNAAFILEYAKRNGLAR